MNRTLALVSLLVVALASSAFGQGIMVPTERTLPPLAIKSQQVQIDIANQVATTTVKQVFVNSTNRELEANYIFPMPADATIRDFAMTVDGKRVSGELVEAKRARQIYQQIVAQAKDPGLLEHLGDNMFRVNIFPVPANGTQTVELVFSQVITGAGGVFRYVYPLKTGAKASQVQDFFSIGAKLTSKTPIKSVYSPSHEIGVSRRGDHEATVGLEQSKVFLDKDFALYWTISEKDFGLNAVAYRPNPDEPGYLMLLLSPKSAVNESEIIAKDVIFVFDTSGSMSGEKIEQAKAALKFCVEALNEKDRFAIITFATDVTTYKDGLIPASKENKQESRDFINRLRAEGATAIYDALEKALAIAKQAGTGDGPARPQVVVFMTDGRPTIGRTGVDEILAVLNGSADSDSELQNLRARLKSLQRDRGDTSQAQAEIERLIRIRERTQTTLPRIFTFGVGDDVNTKLLDQIANKTGGLPEYVRPSEDIEVKVSDFFAKASHPVMTGLGLAFGGEVKIEQMFPRELPDLYFGQQVIAFARYSGHGDISVTLSGTVSAGKTEKHVYEVTLPRQTVENNFIEPLWAHRKVGYLLDQIRLHGETSEVKDEVIRLSRQYKIQTPYTSYLVLEEQHRKQYLGGDVAGRPYGGQGGGRSSGIPAPTPARPGEPATDGAASAPLGIPTPGEREVSEREKRDLDRLGRVLSESRARGGDSGARDDGRHGYDSADRPAVRPGTQPEPARQQRRGWEVNDLKAESGEGAVTLAQEIAGMKKAETVAGPSAGNRKEAAGRTFFLVNGFWVDEKFDVREKPIKMTFVKFGSEAYFAVVTAREDLKEAFALGQRAIIVTVAGQAVVVSDSDGVETLAEPELKELVGK